MTLLKWRGLLLVGLAAIAWSPPAAADEREPLSLREALARSGVEQEGAAPTNPRISGPRQDVAAAAALVDQADTRPNPSISLEAENVAGTGVFSGLDATEYSLTANLPIELGGKRRARVQTAQAEFAATQLRGEMAVAELGWMVRQRYVDAVAAEARVDLLRDIRERDVELARIAQALVENGREPPLRAMRARSALAETEADLIAAQAEALAARQALGALWSDETAPSVPSTFPAIEPPDHLMAGHSGLRLRIAAAEREAAEAQVARERTLAVPDPRVSAGVKRFEESGDQAFVVGVSVPLPIWNRNQGNVAAAQARARAASAREAIALADYRQDVAQARADYLAAEARARTLSKESLPQAEEALRLAQIGYRNGKFPLIEVLAAAETRDGIRREIIAASAKQGRAAALLIRLAAQ